MHFYYGTAQTTGAELLVHVKNTESFYLGGGFSGTWNKNNANGEYKLERISSYDMRNSNPTTTASDQWCSIYGVASFGCIGSVMVKYKAGLGVWDKRLNFDTFNKSQRIVYSTLIGIGAEYSFCDDYGIEIGIDNFNKVTIGITANF
jgi:hypothetical protein